MKALAACMASALYEKNEVKVWEGDTYARFSLRQCGCLRDCGWVLCSAPFGLIPLGHKHSDLLLIALVYLSK